MKLRVSLEFAPEKRIPVGVLMDAGADTAFEYDRGFLLRNLNLSPFRLPLKPGVAVFDHSGGMGTFGLFEDSLPDGWGRRLLDVRFLKRLGRTPTALERLSAVGTNGMGALVYEPADESEGDEGEYDLAAIAASAMDFDAGRAEDVLPGVRRAGGSSGGARPKVFIGFNPRTGEVCPERRVLPEGFEHWIVKFNTGREGDRAGEMEFRHYEAARRAGAEMAESRLVRTSSGVFFATRRFDRLPGGGRLHMASAAGLLHADFRVPGDEYALVFRLTDALTHDFGSKVELFRRVALNVFGGNRDDHLKNVSFLMDGTGRWTLAPFYDFTRASGPNGWHTLSVAGEGLNPGRDDLLRLADDVGLPRAEADEIIAGVRCALDLPAGA